MKKYILSLSVITSLFLATQVKAQSQAKMYQDANTLIENLIKDPGISASDKEALRDALKTNKEALQQLKSPNAPVYNPKPPIKNTSNSDHAPIAKQPRPTPIISGQSNNRSGGRTLISSNAN